MNSKARGEVQTSESRIFLIETVHLASFKFYTGLRNRVRLDVLCEHLEQNSARIVYWNCKKSDQAAQPKDRTFSEMEELFMVLYRLRITVHAQEKRQ